ncbi:MAG TPA: hypothetical protein VGF99_14555 [Myxococcota bacterium]
MSTRALLLVLSMLVALPASLGCSTVIRPTRPSSPITAEGPPLSGVRFEGEEVAIREPGMPVSPSRTWQREVANHTASSLNTLLGATEDTAVARTTVTFDLASPSTFQIGTWKEMSIGLTSTLPDGTIVKSPPVVANIDDGLEDAVVTGMGIGGTVLDVTAGVASIFFIFSPTPVTGIVFIGALLGGLSLNVGQSVAQYVIAGSEEVRWSNLFSKALIAHAQDIRAQIGRGPPPTKPITLPSIGPPPLPPPPPLDPAATPSTSPPPRTGDPPPPVLDPAEAG